MTNSCHHASLRRSLASWLMVASIASCSLPHASLRSGEGDATAAPDVPEDTALVDDHVLEDRATLDALDDGWFDAQPSDVADAITLDATDARADAVDVNMDVACPAGQTRCGESCVDLSSSLLHCGRCDNPCPTPPFSFASCAAGRCATQCLAGYRYSEPGGAPTCSTDVTASANVCPGQDLMLDADRRVTVVGTTVGRPMSRTGSGDCGMLSGPEAYFQVTARAPGVVRVALSSFEPLGFYVLSGACAGTSGGVQLDCSYEPTSRLARPRVQTSLLEATMGQVFTIVVDSPAGAPQPFALTVQHQSNCGASTLTSTAARTCGDGNAVSGDGCSASCQTEPGVVQTSCAAFAGSATSVRLSGELTVFEGNWAAGGSITACNSMHTRGERIVAVDVPSPTDIRFELNPRARARSALLIRRGGCANTSGELCADVLDESASGERVDVSTTMANERLFVIADADRDGAFVLRMLPRNCGDGRLGPGEQCDDGNNVNGDGCDSACNVEPSCVIAEGATDSSPDRPADLPLACPSLRFSGALDPAGGADRDDAARIYLRAGETVVYQGSSGGQGRCPRGVDPVLEVYRGMTATIPMPRNSRCLPNLAALCVDDAVTLCPEGSFVAPLDDWYTFRLYSFDDGGSRFEYELLLSRRR